MQASSVSLASEGVCCTLALLHPDISAPQVMTASLSAHKFSRGFILMLVSHNSKKTYFGTVVGFPLLPI